MECPICDSETIVTGDMQIDGIERCPTGGHYEYTHSYGSRFLYMGDGMNNMRVAWSYKEDDKFRELREKAEREFTHYMRGVYEIQNKTN